jgi:hypothetical protein
LFLFTIYEQNKRKKINIFLGNKPIFTPTTT